MASVDERVVISIRTYIHTYIHNTFVFTWTTHQG